MASRSPKFLIAKGIENEDGYEDTTSRKSSLAESIKADLMLILAGDDRDEEKIPLFYFHEGNC